MLERPDEINVIDLGGAEMLHVFGERPLVASLVEAIPEIIGPLGEHGGIVAFPHGYSVLIHSIEPDTLRVAVNAMEPRGAVADYDAEAESFTLYNASQNIHANRKVFAEEVLKIDAATLHHLAPDVGGGFGASRSVQRLYVIPKRGAER